MPRNQVFHSSGFRPSCEYDRSRLETGFSSPKVLAGGKAQRYPHPYALPSTARSNQLVGTGPGRRCLSTPNYETSVVPATLTLSRTQVVLPTPRPRAHCKPAKFIDVALCGIHHLTYYVGMCVATIESTLDS